MTRESLIRGIEIMRNLELISTDIFKMEQYLITEPEDKLTLGVMEMTKRDKAALTAEFAAL